MYILMLLYYCVSCSAPSPLTRTLRTHASSKTSSPQNSPVPAKQQPLAPQHHHNPQQQQQQVKSQTSTTGKQKRHKSDGSGTTNNCVVEDVKSRKPRKNSETVLLPATADGTNASETTAAKVVIF